MNGHQNVHNDHHNAHSTDHPGTLLTSILAILFITTFTFAIPFKTPVHLDLAGAPIVPIEVSNEEVPRVFEHRIGKPYLQSHKIGSVSCGLQLIIGDHPRLVNRSVLLAKYPGGNNYVEVFSVYKEENGHTRNEIEEFIKRADDFLYMPLVRWPVTINLMVQEDTQFVKVMEGHLPGTISFHVRNEMNLDFVIGIVKYDHHIVDEREVGVLCKKVMLDKRKTPYTIRVTSWMKDGSIIKSNFVVTRENGGVLFTHKEVKMRY